MILLQTKMRKKNKQKKEVLWED